jgi:hypothetical protein
MAHLRPSARPFHRRPVPRGPLGALRARVPAPPSGFRAQAARAAHTGRSAARRPVGSIRSTGSAFSLLSADSIGSVLSFRSALSAGSILAIGSAGSILSIGSAGSILSIGSAGSILSIGSAGSILSIGSTGAVLSIGESAPTGTDTDPRSNGRTASTGGMIHRSATIIGAAALVAAVLAR